LVQVPSAQASTIIDVLMGMLQVCTADGCETKTLGLYCIDHEPANVPGDLSDVLHSAATVYVESAELSTEPEA
jgi:hypothetical protein